MTMSKKYRKADWALDLTLRRELCPHCDQIVAVVNNRFVKHGPKGGLFQCPNSGTVPAKKQIAQ